MLAAPMARLQKKMQAAGTTGKAGATGIPCTMVYGLYRALPGEPGCLATIVREIVRGLDLSVGRPGPHGFAVRIARASSKRTNASIASRSQRP